jgi:putative ABC transport system substrate-binding protein
MDRDESDSLVATYKAALREPLAKLGWIEGRNLRIDIRFGARDLGRIQNVAAELISLAPEVIVTNGSAAMLALQQQTQTIPIVFTAGAVETGVRNIARPEGNVTGFPTFEISVAGKWLELLKEVVPSLARVSVIFSPGLVPSAARSYTTFVEAAASALGVEATLAPVRHSVEAVRTIDAFAAKPNGGLLMLPPPPSVALRETVFELATQHRLPAIYGYRDLAVAGGLMSYGSNVTDHYRGGASYVDRLLRGAKVSELPVQFPTKYELVVNLKAAKAIGLTIPEAFLLRADEVIE